MTTIREAAGRRWRVGRRRHALRGGEDDKLFQTAGGVFRREADAICTQLESEVEFETSMLEESFGNPYDESGRLVLTTEQRAEVLAERAQDHQPGHSPAARA